MPNQFPVKWLLILLLTGLLLASKIPTDSKEAHKLADAVLYPRMLAAMNEYALNHGGVNDPGHLDKDNAGDQKRVKALREAFHAWDDAMKRAGY